MATSQARNAVTSGQFSEKLRHLVASGTTLIQRAAHQRASALPTSIPSLDRSLAGGLPLGCLIEVTGRRSCGRFSSTLATLAATTGAGDLAVLVDLGDGLDPGNATELGVDMSRLLWLRPKHLRSALIATEIALQTGFRLVVLDLGEPPVRGGRGPESAWLRLTRAAAAHQSVVFVSSPYRVSGTAATTVFEAGRAGPRWRGGGRAPRLLEALQFDWQLQKAGNNSVSQSVSFALATPDAFLGKAADDDLADDKCSGRPPCRPEPLDRYRAHA